MLWLRQLSLLSAPIQSRCHLFLPESKFDPGNLIGRLKKRFLKGLLLVKCVMILAKPVLSKCENKRPRMSIKGNWRRHGSEVVIRWCQRFFSRRFATRLRRSILSPLTRKKPLAPRVWKQSHNFQNGRLERQSPSIASPQCIVGQKNN